MSRKTVVSVLAMLFVTVALGGLFHRTIAAKTRVATLTGVRGTVTVQVGGEAAKAGTEKMVLNEGDIVKTGGSGSSVIIRFDDGNMMKLGALAAASIGKLGAAGTGGTNTQIDMSVGKSWARVKKITADSTFSVKTPTAVAGVRGTYYSSEVDQDKTSRFGVFDGEIAVSSVNNPNQQVLVKANQTTTVQAGKMPAQPTAMPANELKEGKSGFSEEEFTSATFDMQIGVNPQVVVPGEKASVTLQIFKNGAPYRKESPLHLKLSGSATFVSNGQSEIDVTTDGSGSITLDITNKVEESVTVDARMKMKVKKSK